MYLTVDEKLVNEIQRFENPAAAGVPLAPAT
jgi:hypothetical protein